MNQLFSYGVRAAAILAIVAVALASSVATAQDAPAAGNELSVDQARLADRFERLETVLTRLAELSASTDPRRAKLLREAIAKSRDQALEQRFETIVSLLEDERLSAAAGRQSELQGQLDELLALLLKADRDRELDSERKRIKAYLKEVGRLIRQEKGIQARTEGGDETKRLAEDQAKVADDTGKLGKSIDDTERRDAEGKPAGDDSPKKPNGESKDGAKESGKPSDGKPSDSKPSDGKPADSGKSKPSDSPSPSPSNPSPGGQPGKSGQSSPSDEPQPSQEPTDRAAEQLKAAQQDMQEAQQQLEQAKREGAAQAQREAIKKLEQAKAELERVLRQLREEEMERTLTMLAARFRKMLDAQNKIYDGTVRADKVPQDQRDHNDEIEAARLSREESLIVREADRALVLLREEGSSLAFPETVSLMRDDMQQVAQRLGEAKVGSFTQQLEQDVIEALEETIAALDKAIKDLDKKRTPPGQSPPAGQPTDPPLVDKLAEIKMIRALQMRINRRTQRYGKIIEGEQAETPELLDALAKLAERQQRIYQATIDLSQGRND